jgi:hypothetical protein
MWHESSVTAAFRDDVETAQRLELDDVSGALMSWSPADVAGRLTLRALPSGAVVASASDTQRNAKQEEGERRPLVWCLRRNPPIGGTDRSVRFWWPEHRTARGLLQLQFVSGDGPQPDETGAWPLDADDASTAGTRFDFMDHRGNVAFGARADGALWIGVNRAYCRTWLDLMLVRPRSLQPLAIAALHLRGEAGSGVPRHLCVAPGVHASLRQLRGGGSAIAAFPAPLLQLVVAFLLE